MSSSSVGGDPLLSSCLHVLSPCLRVLSAEIHFCLHVFEHCLHVFDWFVFMSASQSYMSSCLHPEINCFWKCFRNTSGNLNHWNCGPNSFAKATVRNPFQFPFFIFENFCTPKTQNTIDAVRGQVRRSSGNRNRPIELGKTGAHGTDSNPNSPASVIDAHRLKVFQIGVCARGQVGDSSETNVFTCQQMLRY